MEKSKATSLGATLFLILSAATETGQFFFFFKLLANSPAGRMMEGTNDQRSSGSYEFMHSF